MSGLFGGKSREERNAEKQQKRAQRQHQQLDAADQYDDMVTRALERLTRWAFPDSQVEREGNKWRLWHIADDGKKYVDVTVELQFHGDRPNYFMCDSLCTADAGELTREELDDALRRSICSLSG